VASISRKEGRMRTSILIAALLIVRSLNHGSIPIEDGVFVIFLSFFTVTADVLEFVKRMKEK
jgi:hypothetical protein